MGARKEGLGLSGVVRRMAVYRAYPCPRGAPRPTGRRAARILSGHRHWRLHVAAVAVWWTRTGCPQPGPWTGTPTEHADFTATAACHGGHVITHQKMARAFQARSDDPALRCFFFFWRALAQVNFCIPQDAYVHDHVGHPLWPVDWSDLVYFREPDAATAQVHSAGREGHPPKDSLSDD